MPTESIIDVHLIEEAQKLGQHRTKRDAVAAALKKYIERRKQLKILSLFGTIEFDATYSYNRARRCKRA
jgi:hypothetical protein